MKTATQLHMDKLFACDKQLLERVLKDETVLAGVCFLLIKLKL